MTEARQKYFNSPNPKHNSKILHMLEYGGKKLVGENKIKAVKNAATNFKVPLFSKMLEKRFNTAMFKSIRFSEQAGNCETYGLCPVNRHKISYLEWGDENNEKVLFCVHGLTRNAYDFDYIAKELASEYRVIAIDIAGRGNSDWLDKKMHYGYPLYISDCIKLLNHLNIKQVDWLGTSMGGIIGMMVEFLHHGRINKLILNDVGTFIPKASIERLIESSKVPKEFAKKEGLEEAMRKAYQPFGIKQEEHWQHMFKHGIVQNDEGQYIAKYDPDIAVPIHKETKGFTKVGDVNLSYFWKNNILKSLIVRGSDSDLLLKETAEQMCQDNHNCELIEFEGIGHAPALMEISQIEVIKNWLIS